MDSNASGWPPQADRASVTYFTVLSNSLLERVLEQARRGTLSSNWRDDLRPPDAPELSGVAHGDAANLAVEDIRQMPYAAWEPGRAPIWSDALDAWYVASRRLLTHGYADMSRLLVEIMATDDDMLAHRVQFPGLPYVPISQDELFASVTSRDQQGDQNRIDRSQLYTQQRDRLTASYLAGLVAGGETIDWQQWLRERVAQWPSESELTRRTLIELNDPESRLSPDPRLAEVSIYSWRWASTSATMCRWIIPLRRQTQHHHRHPA